MSCSFSAPRLPQGRKTQDSSLSRTYLTRSNYTGPRLLKTIRSPTQLSTATHNQSTRSLGMVLQDEEDYQRLPESSSDEETEGSVALREGNPPSPKPSGSKKRQILQPTRSSKRRKLQDKPDLESNPSTSHTSAPSAQYNEFNMFTSQSQSKKRQGYGNRHKFEAGADIEMLPRSRQKRPTINTNDIGERARTPRIKLKDFSKDDDFGRKEGDSEPKPRKRPAFLDEGDPTPVSSASTSVTKFQDFGDIEEFADDPALLGSPPTSPDMAKAATEPLEQEPEATTIVCPVCHTNVERTSIPASVKAPRLMPLRDQQDFCRQHRLMNAQSSWETRKYPIIDWQILELVRIPKHIPHLRRVLRREINSYYLEQLEANITKAKGNRKIIREFLTDGILDIAKAGYYGPRGTSMITDFVSSELSKDMSDMLHDKLVQKTGVGGYVVAVLAPELTLRLVMEDTGTADEAEGRRVLDESTELGVLLNPDDDHVEQGED